MIIVVEGIDRVGKTTLINKLVKECGFKLFKHDEFSYPYQNMDNDNETDKMYQLLKMIKLINRDADIIFDRFAWSDYVYGIVSRNYYKGSAQVNLKAIEILLNDLNALTIYVGPTDIRRSEREHGSSLQEHLVLFNEIFDKTVLRDIYVCNYDTIDQVVNDVKLIKEIRNADRV